MAQKELSFFHFAFEDTGGAQIGGQYPLYDRGHIAEIYDANFRSRVAASGKASLIQLFDPATPGAIGGTTPAAGTFTDLVASDLQVSGPSKFARAGSATLGDNQVMVFEHSAATTQIGVQWDASGTALTFARVSGGDWFPSLTLNRSTARVGVIKSAPLHELHVGGTVFADARLLVNGSTGEGSAAAPHIAFGIDPDTGIFRPDANTVALATGGVERLRTNSSGDFFIGVTSLAPGGAGHQFAGDGFVRHTRDDNIIMVLDRLTAAGTMAEFRVDGSAVGSISTTGSATAYNTSSDERLKENFNAAGDALAVLNAVPVEAFDWKADGSHSPFGYVAQRLEPHAPYAVSRGNGPDDMWAVDHSKMVPVLHRAIQQLDARVAQLEGV